MLKLSKAAIIVGAIALSGSVLAGTTTLQNGGDTFVAGEQVDEAITTSGDMFMSGRVLRARGTSGGDLHVSGFDVTITADTSQDVYAAGATVVISGAVAEDLTAAAFSLRTEAGSVTAGNARLAGNTVTIEGPVSGALIVRGRDVILNAPISGDANILAQTLSFGPNATVGGTLTFSTKDKIAVPERVAPEARVVFEPLTGARALQDWGEFGRDMAGVPTFGSILFGFMISLLFFMTLGALVLGFMPRRLSAMRHSIAAAPGQTLLLGVIGLSMLFGMVPITGLTIVGLPFVPIALLAIVLAWTLGYALGAYSVAMRVWLGFGGADDPNMSTRLLVFAGAIVFVALLNFIPFVGWVANYTLVLLGIGGMTRAVFQSLIGSTDVVLDIDMKPIED